MQDLLLRKLSQEQLSLIVFVWGPCGHQTGLNCHDLTSPGPPLLTSALGLRTSLNWGGPLMRYMSACRLLWALSSAFFFFSFNWTSEAGLGPSLSPHVLSCSAAAIPGELKSSPPAQSVISLISQKEITPMGQIQSDQGLPRRFSVLPAEDLLPSSP